MTHDQETSPPQKSFPDSEPRDKKDKLRFRYIKDTLGKIYGANPKIQIDMLDWAVHLEEKYKENNAFRKYWLWYLISAGTYTKTINGVTDDTPAPIYLDFDGEDSIIKKILEVEKKSRLKHNKL